MIQTFFTPAGKAFLEKTTSGKFALTVTDCPTFIYKTYSAAIIALSIAYDMGDSEFQRLCAQ